MADAKKDAKRDAKSAVDRNTEETAERVRELNERIIDASNRGGQVYLDAYERTLKSIADFEERVAGASQVCLLYTSPSPRDRS